MSVMLGNTTFAQVEDRLGYKLTDEDKAIWDEFHCSNADLSGKESGFHVFDMPTCIVFKGDKAGAAIMKMFTPDKITKSAGTFQVMKQG